MPISVTCECGARLEIDEKFLGKEIQCPDCQRPLPTKAPTTPPPLELPDYRRTSGMAVLSLTLSLVGGFIGGGIAGIVVGVFALKEIAAKPTRLEGANLARAGIATGIVTTLLLLAGLISPYVLGVDELLRELALAKRTDRGIKEVLSVTVPNGDISIKRPSRAWGQYASTSLPNSAFQSDALILVNIAEDAFIACMDIDTGHDDKDEELMMNKVRDRVQKSELLNLIGRLGRDAPPEAKIVEKKPLGADGVQELILDLRLAGIERRLLVQYLPADRTKLKAFLRVGCARKNRFDRVQKEFREAFATFDAKVI